MRYRSLILGLDGATFDVIDPLIVRGRLPALAELAANGVRARLRTTMPPVSAPAWVTFLTGRHPGKHGVFAFQNLDGRRYSGFRETLVNSSHFRGDTLLDHVARVCEARTLAYRIPMTYPAWDVPGGVVVSGPPLPDRRRSYARPVTVETELGSASLLSHDELSAAKRARDVARIDACNRHELDLLERTTRRHLDARTDLIVSFTGIPDGLQHAFWGFHDPRSPVYERDAPESLRTIIDRWYGEIDATIGRLLARCDEDTAVIVISDHGGGPAPRRSVNLNAYLRSAGHLTVAGEVRATIATGARRLIDRARQDLPGRMWLKRNLPGFMQRRLRHLRNATAAIAWDRTRVYAIPIFYPMTGVWVNVAGRQQKGIVAPGAEYERLRDTLMREISALKDPATGAPLVASVRRREDVYSGPHAADAPDLIVETVSDHHGGFDLNQLVTDVPLPVLRNINGSHTAEGILIAAGGPFRRGVVLDPPNLADVLPTAVHLLGAPLPADLDGRVLEEALEADYLREHPVRWEARAAANGDRVALSNGDQAEMLKFLQGLGYVE
jgi:predicted AlkP superfamily phosphohydrolase/phosphomutase